MKTHKILSLFVIFALLVIPSLSVQSANNGWQPVADGIEYQKFHLTSPRPVDVFVARLDRSNPNATLESSIAQGSLAAGRETVRGMADRYNGAINYWGQTWGGTNQVAVAINGFFFDGTTGTPWSGQIQSGWYAKRFTDIQSVDGFVWTLNRQAFIGECTEHKADRQFITYLDYLTGKYTQKFSDINVPRDPLNAPIVIYTPQYAASTGTSNVSGPDVEVVVEMERPTLILPQPAMAVGKVLAIRQNQGDSLIPFDHIVISAQGDQVDTILGRLNVGDRIGISQELTSSCGSPTYPWTKAYAGIGGDKYFLQNSLYQTTAGNVPDAHTVIAYSPAYVFFVVTDRWNPGVSEGISYSELATFLVNTLGATDAVSQDHGGSSTMVVNGTVVNNTFCNFTDCRSQEAPNLDGAQITGKSEQLGQIPLAEWNAETLLLEPLVANGMMMVVNHPPVLSSAYAPGDAFPLAAGAQLRLGPGSNYASVLTVPSAVQGTVVGHANGLNGVFAKSQYWWPVDYSGVIGWTHGISFTNLTPQGFLPFLNKFPGGAPLSTAPSAGGAVPPNPFIAPGWNGDSPSGGR